MGKITSGRGVFTEQEMRDAEQRQKRFKERMATCSGCQCALTRINRHTQPLIYYGQVYVVCINCYNKARQEDIKPTNK